MDWQRTIARFPHRLSYAFGSVKVVTRTVSLAGAKRFS
jgi:hypothetical protein